jgi:hypothetical protein
MFEKKKSKPKVYITSTEEVKDRQADCLPSRVEVIDRDLCPSLLSIPKNCQDELNGKVRLHT